MTNRDQEQNVRHSNRLEGSVVAITGAGSGNGRASALRTGREGASLYISDIDAERLEDTLADLKSEGIDAAGGIFDAANIDDAPRFIAAIKDAYGRIDVLVNNAGAVRVEPFPDVSEENWDWTMDLNLKGAFFLMQEAAKPMIEQRSGNIVNIASIAGTFGGPTSVPALRRCKGRSRQPHHRGGSKTGPVRSQGERDRSGNYQHAVSCARRSRNRPETTRP